MTQSPYGYRFNYLFILLKRFSAEPEDIVMTRCNENPGGWVANIISDLKNAIKTCRECKNLLPNQQLSTNSPIPDENHFILDNSGHWDETPAAIVNKDKHVKDWHMARLGHFPRPVDPPQLSALLHQRGLWHPFYKEFDDYEDGPTLDTLDPIPDTVLQLATPSLVYLASQVITNPWTMYKDYGWRLLPSYAQMFHNKQPVLVADHLMPIGLLEPPPFPSSNEKMFLQWVLQR